MIMKSFLLAVFAVMLCMSGFAQTLRVNGNPFGTCSICMECSYDNNGKKNSRIVVTSNLSMEQLDVKGSIVVSQENEVGRKIIEFLPNQGQKITFYAAQCQPFEVEVSEFVTGGVEYQMHIVRETNVPTETVVESTSSNNNVIVPITINDITYGNMIFVKGGTFSMGSNDSDASDDEKPVHSITLSDYYIGETEVTQGLWKVVMGNNPSCFKNGDNYPVDSVSWNDCQNFIKKLNKLTGKTFRLPTEAEWEYAAKGGENSKGYQYSGSNNLSEVAWYGCWSNDKNRTITEETTKPVKMKKPNELGLYDMSGNVYEWCSDRYKSGYYANSPSSNPHGALLGISCVLRGGAWFYPTRQCRVSNRGYNNPYERSNHLGLRLVLVP